MRKVLISLVAVSVICLILAVSLIGVVSTYTALLNGKESYARTLESNLGNKDLELQRLHNDKERLELWLRRNLTEIASLREQNQQLEDSNGGLWTWIATLEGEKNILQNQVNSLKAPKLIMVDLRSEDVRPFLQTPYLHVFGYIVNVGSNRAYSSRLHVVAYQGATIAKDTYIQLGTINGDSWVEVDQNVYYEGSVLTSSSISLEWSS